MRVETFQGVADAAGDWAKRQRSTVSYRRRGLLKHVSKDVTMLALWCRIVLWRVLLKLPGGWWSRREGVWMCGSETLN